MISLHSIFQTMKTTKEITEWVQYNIITLTILHQSENNIMLLCAWYGVMRERKTDVKNKNKKLETNSFFRFLSVNWIWSCVEDLEYNYNVRQLQNCILDMIILFFSENLHILTVQTMQLTGKLITLRWLKYIIKINVSNKKHSSLYCH